MIDEIARSRNTSRCTRLLVAETLVHEQRDRWQYHYGNPSRKTYHNAQWAAKMESIGLCPPPPGDLVVRKFPERLITIRSRGRFQRGRHTELFRGQFALSWLTLPCPGSNNKKYDRRIEQWRETLALAHQNAEAGIDIEAVLSMALLPSVSLAREPFR
jgi:hypothetical protein